MNSGTYYLYEYKHDRRIRTAGFLKLTCAAAGSQLQLHARGLPPTRNESLKLCSFHTNDTVILPEFFDRNERPFRKSLRQAFLGRISVSHRVLTLAD